MLKKNNNNAYNIVIKNKNKKSCLTFDINKFKTDKNNLQSYYSLTDCDKKNKNQNFNINTVQKLEKCYDYHSKKKEIFEKKLTKIMDKIKKSLLSEISTYDIVKYSGDKFLSIKVLIILSIYYQIKFIKK